MSFDFSDRVAIVTGAAVGFGRAIAEDFARRGARVHAVDKDSAELEAAGFGSGRIAAHILDITDRHAVSDWVSSIEEDGVIGILVNNAGGALGRTHAPIEQTAFEDWDAILDVNLNGTFVMTRAVADGMKQSRRGRIINITSGAGFRPSRTGIQAYTAAKHALHGLTRHLAHEFGPFGVTVNAVAPGLQPISPGVKRQWEGYDEAERKAIVQQIPLRSLGTPQDVANVVAFFASDLAGYVTGQVLAVSGGAF